MPSLFRPAGGRTGMTQYLAKYFSCQVRFTISCGFHYRAPPVLVFIAAVGTIFDPKANEFSSRLPIVSLGNFKPDRPPVTSSGGWPDPASRGGCTAGGLAGQVAAQPAAPGGPVKEFLGISATAQSGFSSRAGR
jgi:hypothetical protein